MADQRPIRDPLPLPEPMIESCVRINTDVRDREGITRFYSDRVLVKRRDSTLFTIAGNIVVDGVAEMDLSSCDSSSTDSTRNSPGNQRINDKNERAYLICDEIHNAIYGSVYHGIVLERSSPDDVWQMTTEDCAIKSMFWSQVRRGRLRHMAENPQDEISAMQHIVQCLAGIRGREMSAHDIMREGKIIVPLDFIYDDRYLYTITPYFSGGEMFDLLLNDQRNRFSEKESRYLFRNILDGLESLQIAGLCHRDISLENILVDHENTCVIDMGMCIRNPFLDDEAGGPNTTRIVDHRERDADRCLISSRPACGKMYYMSPEVYSRRPFDGHAVDMWAAGVCLFMMLSGQPPWEVAQEHDSCFYNIAMRGRLAELLNHWNIPLSDNAMNLMQQMLCENPQDRLTLQQVRDHPWMNGDETNPLTI